MTQTPNTGPWRDCGLTQPDCADKQRCDGHGPTTAPPEAAPDNDIDEILENLYYAGIESDSIEVVGGGRNEDIAVSKAKAALTRNRNIYAARIKVEAFEELLTNAPVGDKCCTTHHYAYDLLQSARAQLTFLEGTQP